MIEEQTFLAAIVQLHSVEGRPPRAIQLTHVLQKAADLSQKNVERSILLMQTPRARATMKRCRKLHKRLWEAYHEEAC